jgi:hypothetical protein
MPFDEAQRVIDARKEQRPTSMEQLDSRLKHIEMQLERRQEEEKAKRYQIFKELDTRCNMCGQIGHFKSECKTQNYQAKQLDQKLQSVIVDPSENDIKQNAQHSIQLARESLHIHVHIFALMMSGLAV